MYFVNLTIKKACAFFAVLIFISCASGTKVKPESYGGLGQPTDPVPFMAAARTGTLPNGLRYYILENRKPENRVYLTLAVNAGSVLEEEDEQGLAHFVEHMAFNGTARFPESELINYLRSLGMRFGPEVNAYTGFDETVFGIEVPTEIDEEGTKGIPAKALEVIDDWTHAITFVPADVNDERLVIMEEYRSSLGAGERIQQKIVPIIFEGSPYADRLPIGLPEIIQGAPPERLENFYKTWYRPDNMAIILVGDFDGAKVEAALPAYFTAPAPAAPLNHPYYDLPPPKKGNFSAHIITDPELTFTRIDMYHKQTPQALQGDLAAYRQGLLDNLIDRMLSLRFDEAASKPETPYVWAAAGNLRYGSSSRYYVMASQVKTGSVEAAFRELLREKESMIRYGFTEAEIDRAKRSLVSDLEQMVSEQDRQESNDYVWNFTNHFLNGQMVADVTWELEAVKKLLPGIGAKEIQRTVQDYFAANDLRILLTSPEAEAASLPTERQIRTLVAQSRRAKIAPPEAAVFTDELIGEDPRPGTINSEVRDPSGALIWELSNGAKVILKETRNRNNEIVLYAIAPGGTTSVPAAENISVSLAAEMLEASGLGPYSRPELVKKLADKQVSISFWTSTYLRGLQGSATTGDIKTLFEMLYLGFTDPRIDPEAVTAMLDQYRTSLATRNEDPDSVFVDEISRIIYGNNPWFKPMELADLSQVDQALAEKFLKGSLNPADYTFVFTGNIDIAAMRTYTETYLASIPPGASSWKTWTDPGIVRPDKTERSIYKGKEERSLVFLGWYVPAPYSEAAGTVAGVLSEYLDILLTEEIREKLGGVYSVSASAALSPLPAGELSLQVYFACDPKRAGELSAAIERLFQGLAGGTVNEDMLHKSREALKKNWETSMESNIFIARSYANFSVILNLPFSRLDRRPELYDAVSAADLQQAMARLLQKGPVRGILYPEAWH
ncbi:insulinase family protein [Treponema sp. TIM-1]|uniref:M16 family metallopeptidase n=1 Tax=Treponema sp. TIM-1 TaxID=2898417 RepID=UPI00397F5F1C